MAEGSEQLSFRQRLGYRLGDIFGGGSGTLIGFFDLAFLTDVVRIGPVLAGVVILLSRVYDALTDPYEGVLSDRTRTPFGRRRPCLMAGRLLPVIFKAFGIFIAARFPLTTKAYGRLEAILAATRTGRPLTAEDVL